jgi:hypothetical protein
MSIVRRAISTAWDAVVGLRSGDCKAIGHPPMLHQYVRR